MQTPRHRELEWHADRFDLDAWARGRDLYWAGRVEPLEHDAKGRLITALVSDGVEEMERHSVYIDWDDTDPEASLSGFLCADCSCWRGLSCEHVVAALCWSLLGPSKPDVAPDGSTPQQHSGGAPSTTVDPSEPARRTMEQWLALVRGAVAEEPPLMERSGPQQGLLYALSWKTEPLPSLCLELSTATKNKHRGDGRYIATTPFRLRTRHLRQPPRLFQFSDQEILHLVCQDARPLEGSAQSGSSAWLLPPAAASAILEAILVTRRAHWVDPINPPLAIGRARPGTVAWEMRTDGSQRLTIQLQSPEHEAIETLPLPTPFYVAEAEAGKITTELPQPVLDAVADCPWLAPEEVADHSERLRADLPPEAFATLPAPKELQRIPLQAWPRPVLRLSARGCSSTSVGYPPGEPRIAVAELCFDYEPIAAESAMAPIRVSPADPAQRIERLQGDALVCVDRDQRAEERAATVLDPLTCLPDAFSPLLTSAPATLEAAPSRLYIAPDERSWQKVLTRLPELREQGWRIEAESDFPLSLPREPEACELLVEPQDDGWFSVAAGVVIDGERIDLLPPLLAALHELPADARKALGDPDDPTRDEGHLPIRLEDGRSLAMPLSRLRPLLATLLELFDRDLAGGRLRLPPADLGRLTDLETEGWPWQGPIQVRQLAERLTEPLEPATAPPGLQAELRPYQAIGLSWLQRLAADGFSGVLADDMGLGKTLQFLAHLLAERAAGRSDRPSLVVAPTSVVSNWHREAARFAPELTVHVYHGPNRNPGAIDGVDLVITSYALLRRDSEPLAERNYHLVVLDEAQNIKNPRSRVAQAARRLTARQRLCLSGTPLENHLGELWSLFHFLMPDFLGTERTFHSRYRRPIELHGERYRQAQLAARIRPFLLRRTKERVAPELPAKTDITRYVEMAEAQRDLYEGVRLAVHERVQEALAEKGLTRSRIEILDALLKLRQVCCDPRLVKAGRDEAARRTPRKPATSAKLQALIELLLELLEESRRVLLFSQFTTMLKLIERELSAHGLTWSKLTGETQDRDAAVARFQSGEVPLMLISLKAGGTGLNLTAADTVIHYDPWWNPATEAQATDRAHRIGQDQPVFVYRLICAGTVEERMQRLQAEKGALAAGLYGDKRDCNQPLLSADDLELLLDG